MLVVFITRTLCTFIGGLVLALAVIQEDPWFLKTIEQQIVHQFSKTFDCALQCNVKSINFFALSIDLENINVTDGKPGLSPWYWSCKKCVMQTSWLSFLLNKKFPIIVMTKKFLVQSTIQNNTLAIMPHLKKMLLEPSVLPIDLQRVQVFNGTLTLFDLQREFNTTLQWHADIAIMQQRTKAACSLTSAKIIYKNNQLLEALTGKLGATTRARPGSIDIHSWAEMQAVMPWIPENNGHVECSASCRNNAGRFELHNEDHAFNLEITPIQDCLMAQISGNFPIANILRAFDYSFAQDCRGLLEFNCSVDLYDPLASCKGALKISNAGYKNYNIQEVESLWNAYQDQIHGSLTCSINPAINFQGTAHYTFDNNNLEAMITNASTCAHDTYSIAPHNFLLTGSMRNWHSLEGSLACTIIDTESQEPKLQCTATLQGMLDNATLHGSCNADSFDGTLCCIYPYNSSLVYRTGDEELASVKYANNTVSMLLKNPLLQRCMQYVTGHNFIGNGDIAVTLQYDNDPAGSSIQRGIITGTCSLKDGMIRLSPLYNIVKAMEAAFTIDYFNRSLALDKLRIGLHRGTLTFDNTKAFFDENYTCSTAYIPFSLESCFLSWHKDVFALLSGQGAFAYTPESAMLQGNCVIERSHIKGNILGGEFGNSHSNATMPQFTQNCGIDMQIKSKKPIEVQTSFLEATAALDCTLTGTIEAPNLGGSVDISHGKLNFPYKPLYITRSNVYFLPQELDNPSIILHAKNSIKQFEITLTVTGTVKKPSISFSSCPSLTEEQIITLLFTGSEEAALSAVLQTMIVQNIQNLVLGPAEQARPMQKYLKNLLKPFKNIRVVPSFSDETGRAGLRAAVEVEVNDRLRGLIQKNFSLPEDIYVEVDYALSDEVTIKGIRNERGNMGAEMEMRFKF